MSALEGGRNVGRYRIVRLLGAGAMGEVYLAEDPHIERLLAIKTVRLAGRPQDLEDRAKRLLREARAAGRMLHPHIVTLFDAGEHEGMLYLAFEYVRGADLAARLETGPPLTLAEVLRIGRETALALDFAHKNGIVHRDVKPSNILLDADDRVKVADFGIAKMAGQTTELTMLGSVVGSPQYLSPEQVKGDDLDGRSDVFSLGVVLYELLSGRRPFEGDTITALVYQILHKDPPPVSSLREVPARLSALLDHMLVKDRDERLQSARLVADELAAVERELSDETLAEPAVTAPAELAPTRVLPPYSTGAPVAGTAGTVPPPPPPPAPAGAATAGRIPPAPQAAAVPPPPQPAGAPVSPGRGAGTWIALAMVGLVVVLAGLAAGWLVLRRVWTPLQERAAVEGTTDTAETAPAEPPVGAPVPALPSDGRSAPAAPPARDEARPSTPNGQSPQAPQSPPAADRRSPSTAERPAPPVQSPPQRQPERTPATAGTSVTPREPVQTPAAPVQLPGPARRAGGERTEAREEATAPAPAVESPDPAPAVERPAQRRAAAPERAPDRTIQSGLALTFRVTPPDAHVLVDGTVIGRADEWAGGKKSRTYTLPGAGDHLIKIRKDGLREVHVLVQASETGGTTPIIANLSALPAREVSTPDLQVYRVREAVALRVEPPGATVSVDGQPAGKASQYAGRIGRPREWLELPAGTHRISIEAPGFERRDLAVEVTAGAERERERIEVRLQRSGGG